MKFPLKQSNFSLTLSRVLAFGVCFFLASFAATTSSAQDFAFVATRAAGDVPSQAEWDYLEDELEAIHEHVSAINHNVADIDSYSAGNRLLLQSIGTESARAAAQAAQAVVQLRAVQTDTGHMASYLGEVRTDTDGLKEHVIDNFETVNAAEYSSDDVPTVEEADPLEVEKPEIDMEGGLRRVAADVEGLADVVSAPQASSSIVEVSLRGLASPIRFDVAPPSQVQSVVHTVCRFLWAFVGALGIVYIFRGEWDYWTTLGGSAS